LKQANALGAARSWLAAYYWSRFAADDWSWFAANDWSWFAANDWGWFAANDWGWFAANDCFAAARCRRAASILATE
jgi:hypothetical protein